MYSYTFQQIPSSRIATFDVYAIGLQKHHVVALLELDVTEARTKLKTLKTAGARVSFNAWLVKIIGTALAQHRAACAYLYSKRKLILFDDINIVMVVEKVLGSQRVPMPLLIEKANEKSVVEITQFIENAKNKTLTQKDIVLNKRSKTYERLYYYLPGFLRRMIWHYLLRHPKIAHRSMGNAVITSIGMMGRLNGWLIQRSVHPISFGIGAIIKKPVVLDDTIQIREILNVTILLDHDVIDGAPMVRFVNDFTKMLEKGAEL